MPINALVGGALIGGGANLLGNLLGYKSNKDTNKMNYEIAQMNNEFNERMLQKEMDYNTNMWHMQNAYNTPSAQRARYEAAGINPYMALGNIQSGQAGSVGGVKTPSAQPVTMQPFQPDFSGIGQAVQSYFAQKIQDKAVSADANLKEQQAEQVRIENKYTAAKAIEMINNLKEDTTSKALKNYYQQQENRFAADMFSSEVLNSRRQGQLIEAEVRSQDVQTAIQTFEFYGLPQKYQLTLAGMTSEILLRNAQTKKTKAETQTELQKMFKTFFETKGLKINNSILERSADYIVGKAKWDSIPQGVRQFDYIGEGFNNFFKFSWLK